MDKQTLKQWFSRGKKPTGEQFAELIDSFRHKDDPLNIDDIRNLLATLSKKVDITTHNTQLAQKANVGASYTKAESFNKNEIESFLEEKEDKIYTGDVVLSDLSVISWSTWFANTTSFTPIGLVCDPVKKTFVCIRPLHELYSVGDRLYNGFNNSGSRYVSQTRASYTDGRDTQLYIQKKHHNTNFNLASYFPAEKVLMDNYSPYFVPAYDEIVPFYNALFSRDYLGVRHQQIVYGERMSLMRNVVGATGGASVFYSMISNLDLYDNDYFNIRVDGNKNEYTQSHLQSHGVIFLMGIYATNKVRNVK